MSEPTNQKRKRQIKASYKKWSSEEQDKLVTFLKENRPIEKPTAQAYYRRYMQQNGIDSDWNLIRCKVRNMRQTFQKVKNWENSTGVGALNEGETIRDATLKKCPYFYDLDEIFGYKEPSFRITVIDTETNGGFNEMCTGDSFDFESENERQPVGVNEVPAESSIECSQVTELLLGTGEPEKNSQQAKNRKGIYSRTALSDIMQVQTQLIQMKEKKIDVDVQLKEKELELQKERFSFEKLNRLEELKVKEKEIESKEKIQILEMQMKERIALKEIEMKERIEMEKLKR